MPAEKGTIEEQPKGFSAFWSTLSEIFGDSAKMAAAVAAGDIALDVVAGPDLSARAGVATATAVGAAAAGDAIPAADLLAVGMIASVTRSTIKAASRNAKAMTALGQLEIMVSGKSPSADALAAVGSGYTSSAEESAEVFSSVSDATIAKIVGTDNVADNKPEESGAAVEPKAEPKQPKKDHKICPHCNEEKKYLKSKNKILFKKVAGIEKIEGKEAFKDVEVCTDCDATLRSLVAKHNKKIALDGALSDLEVLRDAIIKSEGTIAIMVDADGKVVSGMEEMHTAASGILKTKMGQRNTLIDKIKKLSEDLGIPFDVVDGKDVVEEPAPAAEPEAKPDPKAAMASKPKK